MKKINTEVSIRVTKSYSVPLHIAEYVHDRSLELGCSASEFVARCIKQEMKKGGNYEVAT